MLISKYFIPLTGHDAINLEQEMRNGPLMTSLKTKDSESGFYLFLKGLEPKMLISKDFIPFAGHDAINLEQEMAKCATHDILEN